MARPREEHDDPSGDAYVPDEHLPFAGRDAGNGRRGEHLRDSMREPTAADPGLAETVAGRRGGSGSVPLTSARALSWPRMLSVVVIKAWSRPHAVQGLREAVRFTGACRPVFPLTVSLAQAAAGPHRSSHCGLPGLSHVDRCSGGHLFRQLPGLRGRRSATARVHREAAGPTRTPRNDSAWPGQSPGALSTAPGCLTQPRDQLSDCPRSAG